jgi:hypothetical protein
MQSMLPSLRMPYWVLLNPQETVSTFAAFLSVLIFMHFYTTRQAERQSRVAIA